MIPIRRRSDSRSSPTFSFPGADPLLSLPFVERLQLLVREARFDATGIELDVAAGRPQRLPERLLVNLRLQVPKGGVQAANGVVVRTFVPPFEDLVHHHFPQSPYSAGIPTHQQRRQSLNRFSSSGGAEAYSGQIFVGVDEQRQGAGLTPSFGGVDISQRTGHLKFVELCSDTGYSHGFFTDSI